VLVFKQAYGHHGTHTCASVRGGNRMSQVGSELEFRSDKSGQFNFLKVVGSD